MNLDMNQGMLLALLIMCMVVGSCLAEETPGYLMYVQGGSSTLTEGTTGNLTLTTNDVIPYYEIQVADRTILLPMEGVSSYDLPLNTALVLNSADGELVYLVKTRSWLFDAEKKTLTLEIQPLEFYEGERLKRFTETGQNLSAEKGGKELSTGLYFEITGENPDNEIWPPKTDCVYMARWGKCPHTMTEDQFIDYCLKNYPAVKQQCDT
jgi:hypothetical protein